MEVPAFVLRQLETIDLLSQEITEATQELETLAWLRPMPAPDDGARRGPLTSPSFVSAIDRVDRFKNAHRLESYLGLTPGEDSSSDRRRITSCGRRARPTELSGGAGNRIEPTYINRP
ncbi:MAG TPA: transposase [Anaeromyxobacteraceae bacterium]|nr:transposase [Anaeromyxobacteraceae bacterium]